MNNQEAINVMEKYTGTGVSGVVSMAHVLAISALEKQIPRKPIERHYEEPGEKPYIKNTCPAGCRITLHGGKYGFRYCPICGQALDWGEEDDYE